MSEGEHQRLLDGAGPRTGSCAWRTIHLQAIRAILAGEDPATVAERYPRRIRSALSAVDQTTA